MDNIHTEQSVLPSVRELLKGAIDYAGLFPPSNLSMSDAVINYAAYRNSNFSWMLGRFVLPVSQLPEFMECAQDFMARDSENMWRLSALSGEDINKTVREIESFNQEYAGPAVIDSLEVKANTISKIDNTASALPEGVTAYFEIDTGDNLADLVAELSKKRQRAKIRTGGVTVEAFPSTADIIRFVKTCLAANVPFKATAGLHHPIRCYRPLTYESNAQQGTMHGFLNLFLMTGVLLEGFRPTLLEHIMEEEYDEVFAFDDTGVTWQGEFMLSTRSIERLRRLGIQSFGSCSFDEPVADLQKLGIL
ncbi:MAG: hypothetical protein H0X08_06165 [Blastocatellia bacterium]|nr:hypothetical protein [Blastocatellia bacterium]